MTEPRDNDMLARLVRNETLVSGMAEQLKELSAAIARISSEQRQMSETQNKALVQLQEHNANARREDQDASRAARQEDQKAFNAALLETLKKVEAISAANTEMADKYIKREDLLWVRQAVGSVLVLIGGGLWTWWLNTHK